MLENKFTKLKAAKSNLKRIQTFQSIHFKLFKNYDRIITLRV